MANMATVPVVAHAAAPDAPNKRQGWYALFTILMLTFTSRTTHFLQHAPRYCCTLIPLISLATSCLDIIANLTAD